MQRGSGRPGRNKYVRSGGGYAASEEKRSRALFTLPRGARRALFAVLAAGLLVFLISNIMPRGGNLVRLEARISDNIQAFGKNVLFYDGMSLICVDANGNSQWDYALGGEADFSTDGTRVALWAGSQLHLLDARGQPTLTQRFDGPIRFARVGATYVAACVGDATAASVLVLSHTGTLIETVDVPDLYPLDIGFFSAQGQRMWVLGLDLGGNAPITRLSTYEPGRMSTGAVELSDDIVYKVYPYGDMLAVADTSKVRVYNYKCVEQADIAPILVYGWTMAQSRAVGRVTYGLLRRELSSADAGPLFSELRLLTNMSQSVQSIRLLTPCFAGGLSEKGVYAIGAGVIHYLPYGENTLRTASLNYTLTDFICMLDDGRAVVVSGEDVLIIKLPEP